MIEQNFIQLYENSFKLHWHLPALSDYSENNTLTYGDLAKEIARLHLLFENAGIKKGDKIALSGKNHSSWAIVFLATITYGAIIVPILHDFHPESMMHIVKHSDAKLFFTQLFIWEQVNKESVEIPIYSIPDFKLVHNQTMHGKKLTEKLTSEFIKKYPKGFSKNDVVYPKISNKSLICLNYTSGTTGFSKGVMLTANNYAGNIMYAHTLDLLFKGERNLAFLPLAHTYGCAFDFLYALSAGVHTTLFGKVPTPSVLIAAFKEVKPNLVITVPLILEKIYKQKILPLLHKPYMKVLLNIPVINSLIYRSINKSLREALGNNFREVIIGGAALSKEVEAFFHKIKFPFTVGYGMTECGPLISYAHHYDFLPTSCGQILKGIMEARIDSENPETIAGEIQVRGENVMKGYYKKQEDTKAAFTEDGWLRTGDLGVLDKHNRLYIKGRSKTMLLSASGQNIYPEEIEARLNNMPYVSESLVIQKKKRFIGLVFPDLDAVTQNKISEEKLCQVMESNRNKLNTHLAKYERLIAIEIMPKEFEKTPKKSIKRYLYQKG